MIRFDALPRAVGMGPMLLLLLGCTGPTKTVDSGAAPLVQPWVTPDEWGPLDVGARTLEWVDSRGKPMTAEVWYPASLEPDAVAEPYPPLGLGGRAVRKAAPDLRFGPYPLIAFSHGYGGIRFQSIFLTEHWASHGFVVVAPDHTHNTMLDMDGSRIVDVVLERPGDVSASVDRVLAEAADADSPLAGVTEAESYAMVGHSFGAFTAMVVGGGTVDLAGVVARCAGAGGRLCDEMEGISPELLGSHPMNDERARVSVPLSPGVWYAFGPDGESAPGLRELRAPLVFGGDQDPVLEYDTEIRPSWQHMSAPKTLVTVADAGHYAFSDICALAPFFTDECDGPEAGWADIAWVQQLTRTTVLAHIQVELLGEERAAEYRASAWLAGEAGVTVER